MTDDDVTHVTRNDEPPPALLGGRSRKHVRRTVPPEIKLIIDFAASAAMLYYVTHPDCPERARDKVKMYWSRVVHRLSVWVTRQDIRSLPEVDE